MKNWLVVRRYFNRQLILSKEEKEAETYQEIAEGSRFSGYNLWILGFSMVIACIGLNTDSVAAVIGAMLISPLMDPLCGFRLCPCGKRYLAETKSHPQLAVDVVD